MKKLFRSAFMKAAALILCGALGVLAVSALAGFVLEHIAGGEDFVYGFEESFEQSSRFSSLLQIPEFAILDALSDSSRSITIYGPQGAVVTELSPAAQPAPSPLPAAADGGEAETEMRLDTAPEEIIKKALEPYIEHEALVWFVRYGEHIFTNCGAKSPEELYSHNFYRMCAYNSRGVTGFSQSGNQVPLRYRDSSFLPEGTELTICTAVREEYEAPIRALWEKQAEEMRLLIGHAAKLAAALGLLIVYLAAVWGAGCERDGRRWYGVWTELYIAAAVGFGFAAGALVLLPLDAFGEGRLPLYLARGIAFAGAGLGLPLTMLCLLELVRKIRLGRFFADSLCFKALRLCWRIVKKLLGLVWAMLRSVAALLRSIKGKRSAHIFLAMLFAYSFVLGLCSILSFEGPLFVLLAIAAVCFAAFVLIHRARDLDAIKAALSSIRAGQLSQSLPEIKSADLGAMGRDIEEIAAGLDRALDQRLRAERLKTELITNVSHDLKTPLTSIINYTRLLSESEGLSEEAADYAAIIAAKSERLRVLTEDLFAVSKAQSGAEELKFERLNAALLIEQAMAEREREIESAPLKFVTELDAQLHFSADGRKMSRVLGNLIDNALKYSLDGTRVFISAAAREDKAVIEIKNISACQMDFDPEEICARFVRGDESRSDGGSGLGLAIAKSFTEACGGEFRVITDGDLFKARIVFPAM